MVAFYAWAGFRHGKGVYNPNDKKEMDADEFRIEVTVLNADINLFVKGENLDDAVATVMKMSVIEILKDVKVEDIGCGYSESLVRLK